MNQIQTFFPNVPNCPRDVVNTVLSFLHPLELVKIQRVSKEWRRIASQQKPLKDSQITGDSSSLYKLMLQIHSPSDILWTDKRVDEMTKKFCYADELEISNPSTKDSSGLTDRALTAAARNCPLLQRFKMCGMGDGFPAITGEGLKNFLIALPKIKSLSLLGINGPINWSDLIALVPRLESINIDSVHLDAQFFSYVSDHFPNARYFGFSQGVEAANPVILDDEWIEKLTAKHPKLDHFRADHCGKITAKTFDIFQRNCPQLTGLNLYNVPLYLLDSFHDKKIGKVQISLKA